MPARVEPSAERWNSCVDSPDPILLKTVKLNKKNDQAGLSTNMLKNVGPYQIEAEFVPTTQVLHRQSPRHPWR